MECISRGAEEVTFIEHNKEVINILEKNCKKFSILNQVILINNNVDDFLNLNSKKKYNIIFFDPPFADKEFVKILKILKNKKNFEKNHIIIIHRERGSNDYFEDLLNILLIRSYGRSKIIFGKF